MSCQSDELGEFNLETSMEVETAGLTWQLQLEEVMVHRARQAARNLVRQVTSHGESAGRSEGDGFVPLAESIDVKVNRECGDTVHPSIAAPGGRSSDFAISRARSRP